MTKTQAVSVGIAFVLAIAFISHAQTVATTGQSASADSIVSVVAEAQGLQLVPPDQVPFCGTFWMVLPGTIGGIAPMPCPPLDSSEPVFQIAAGQFLVDETDGQVPVMTRRLGLRSGAAVNTVASATAVEADAVANLIAQVQATATSQQMRMQAMAMGMDIPSPGGDGSGNGGGFSPMMSSSYSIDTNTLWLEITNVSNGWSYLNLHNGTNQVYAIWSTTNLSIPFANWQVETEVRPTNGTVIPTITPFALQNLNRQNLFLRAEDWTGVDSNGDGIPDWWIWEFFGNFSETATNLDPQGNTLGFDYTNSLDPNIISFSLTVTNQHVNSMSAPVQVNVTAGVPSCFAVLVDDTNFADATWNAYTSSNINVYLGLAQGWHDVWVGLRGFPPNATQTWQWKHLNLTMPPVLTITNPVSGVVDEPMIQIYGYCQDILASISYDISNTLGVVTNLQSEVTDQYYDTNVCAFTTNYFECLDVPLTNGLNIITIHAADLAGDTTTTNFSFTLDYSNKTNPPVVQITWPQSGTQISGANFTCDGFVSDPTVTISATITDTNGDTNVVPGLVERNGTFWIQGILLNPGTNALTLTVTDAAGNTSVTNISVVQSTLVLAMNPVTPDSQLWQPTVNLTGIISDASQAVWVNGVKGHNNGNGTWYANNVPTTAGGTASFTITAYGPTEQQPDGSYGN